METHINNGEMQNSGIKKIVDCKVENGQQLYKVKWEPTWEPAEHLVSCQHLVDEFWSHLNLVKKNEEKAEEYKKRLKLSFSNNNNSTNINRLSEDICELIDRTNSTSTGSCSLIPPGNVLMSSQINGQNKMIFKDEKPFKSCKLKNTSSAKPDVSSPASDKGSTLSGLKYIENFDNQFVRIILVCKICNKEQSLKQSGHWKQHFLTHSDQKPHICTLCGKGFVRPLGLRSHMQSKHGSNIDDTAGMPKDLFKQEPDFFMQTIAEN